jgi:hypothetical protein
MEAATRSERRFEKSADPTAGDARVQFVPTPIADPAHSAWPHSRSPPSSSASSTPT